MFLAVKSTEVLANPNDIGIVALACGLLLTPERETLTELVTLSLNRPIKLVGEDFCGAVPVSGGDWLADGG
jgi:hypothetical protein